MMRQYCIVLVITGMLMVSGKEGVNVSGNSISVTINALVK